MGPKSAAGKSSKTKGKGSRAASSAVSVTATVLLNNRHTQYPVIGKVCRLLGWQTTSEVQAQQNQVDDVPDLFGSGSAASACSVSPAGSPRGEGLSSGPEWSVYWADSGLGIDKLVRTAKCYQKLNHFPGMVNIYRKSHLARSMMRMQKASPGEYDFFPKTWILPFEANDVAKYLDCGRERCVIVKPSGGAQGKGIYLTMTAKGVKADEDAVAQVYINRPLLIDGMKFDLRIYVLVTSVDPLRILIYKEGLVRLCTTPFRIPDPSNLSCSYMHLTNYSVNKHNPLFQQPNGDPSASAAAFGSSEEQSSKRSLGWLWSWMETKEIDADVVWRDICDVAVKTLISIQATLAQSYRSCKVDSSAHSPFTCFEILGFDIMITESLKPCLIEVNHMPSFRTDSALDSRIKFGLIENTLRLLNVSPDDKRKFQTRSAMLSQIRLYGKTFSGKGKKSTPKMESAAEMWAKYEKNEAKNRGNFELIYPTNVYENQVTARKQPLYQELLSKAHCSLGSPIVASVDDPRAVLEDFFKNDASDDTDSDDVDDEEDGNKGEKEEAPVIRDRGGGRRFCDNAFLEPSPSGTSSKAEIVSGSQENSPKISQSLSASPRRILNDQEVETLAERVKAALHVVVQNSIASLASSSKSKTSGKRMKKRRVKKTGKKVVTATVGDCGKTVSAATFVEDSESAAGPLPPPCNYDNDQEEEFDIALNCGAVGGSQFGEKPNDEVSPTQVSAEDEKEDAGEEEEEEEEEERNVKGSTAFSAADVWVEETQDAAFFQDDAPPIPSVPLLVQEASPSLHLEATAQMERLRQEYNFLRNQWVEQFNNSRGKGGPPVTRKNRI